MRTQAQRMLIRALLPDEGTLFLLPRRVKIRGQRQEVGRPPNGEQLRAAVIEETADDDGGASGNYPPCPDCHAERRGGRVAGRFDCWWCGSRWVDTRYADDWRRGALLSHPRWPGLDAETQASMMAGDVEWCGCDEVVPRGTSWGGYCRCRTRTTTWCGWVIE